MKLYHGTSFLGGKSILCDRYIKSIVKRFYTPENNGKGATTDGFVYLSNDLIYALYYGYRQNIKSDHFEVYIFRVEIDRNKLLCDEDEMKLNNVDDKSIYPYPSRLDYSLCNFKSCRIDEDISFEKYDVEYGVVNLEEYRNNIIPIIENIGEVYTEEYDSYNQQQKELIDNIKWIKL